MTFLYDVSVVTTSILIAFTILYAFDCAYGKITSWMDGE